MKERLTEEQEKNIVAGLCPDCDGQLLEGPEGGSAINVRCRDCKATFWVAWPFSPRRLSNPQRKR